MQNEVRPVDLDSDPNGGLKVTENEDGSFQLEWDAEDPRWAMLNDLTSEEITAIILEYAQQVLNDREDYEM